MVTPEQKREAVEYAINTHYLRPARACKLFAYSRSNLYYNKKMPQKDQALKELIASEIKYNEGREKVTHKIQSKRSDISSYRIRRVYTQQGFSLYKRMKSKRIKRANAPIEASFTPNNQWAIDFMSDALQYGRRFRTLNVIDHYNRKCLLIHCAFSLTSKRVTKQLDLLIAEHGKPAFLRTDNGPEFTSKVFQQWLSVNQIEWIPIAPGHPEQNAIIERFNRTYRESVLDAELFKSIKHAQAMSDTWIKYYNEQRPHQSLNNQTPNKYVA